MSEAEAEARAKNPVLLASSRVPAWAALGFAATVFVFQRVGHGSAGDPSLALFLAFAALLVVLAAIPRRVELGAEGLSIAWLGAPRLVRYSDVRRAAPRGTHALDLALTSGEWMRLFGVKGGSHAREAGLERIWQTLSKGAYDGVLPIERALLARGKRDAREWAAALAAIVSSGAAYRTGIHADRLWSIAANPAASAELRAAAAVSIAPTLDDRARARLDAIAQTTLEDALGAVLARVTTAREPAELAAALDAVAPRAQDRGDRRG